MPLVAIFAAVSSGLKSEVLTGFFRRNVAAGKLALAVLFFLIGSVVLVNVGLT